MPFYELRLRAQQRTFSQGSGVYETDGVVAAMVVWVPVITHTTTIMVGLLNLARRWQRTVEFFEKRDPWDRGQATVAKVVDSFKHVLVIRIR
jgi:hypothetical protein